MDFLNDDIMKNILAKVDTPGCRTKLLDWQVCNVMRRSHEGHTSNRARLLVRYTEENDTIVHEKYFFLKLTSNISKSELTEAMFRREYHVYAKIIPQMVDANYECSPRCYYYDDREHNLILEDVTAAGYERRAQRHLLDFSHTVTVLKEIAKFHGHSVKIMETKPQTLDEVRKEGYALAIALRCESFAVYFEALFYDTMCRFEPDFTRANSLSIKRCARKLTATGSDEMDKSISYGVLNHGDFRTENIMFNYGDGTEKTDPRAVRLIDYQLSFWADPSVDLIYLFVLSVQFDIFEKHFDQFLQIYTDTLADTLTHLGSERRPITVDELRRNIYGKFKFWILCVLAFLPPLQYDPDDPLLAEKDVFAIWGTKESDRLIDSKYCLPLLTKWLRFFVEKSSAGYAVFEATT